MDTSFEIVGWVNAFLGLVAFVGYCIRLVINIKRGCLRRGQVLLAAYAVSSFSISLFFVLLVTGWYKIFAESYYLFSVLYIRPFFTFLVTTFIISTFTRPEIKAAFKTVKEKAWKTHRSTGRK